MKLIQIFILCTLLLSACSASHDMGDSTGQTYSIIVSETNGSTLFRSAAEEEFVLAQVGDEIHAGAELITGSSIGTKLDFSDGTILRVAANSYLTIKEANSEAVSQISLLTGKVWIILNGEEITIATTIGEAVVTGSYMSVSFDSLNQEMQVTCLEGNCAIQNDLGITSLTDGQAASISGIQSPSQARSMDDQQLSEWVQVNPEAVAVAGRTPDPAYPKPTDQVNAEYWTNIEIFHPYLENNCLGGDGKYSRTNWNWIFVWVSPNGSPVVFGMTIHPGESTLGWLPAGQYTYIADWTDEGSISNRSAPGEVKIYDANVSGPFVALCPDDPPLPGRPADFHNP